MHSLVPCPFSWSNTQRVRTCEYRYYFWFNAQRIQPWTNHKSQTCVSCLFCKGQSSLDKFLLSRKLLSGNKHQRKVSF